VCTADPAAPAPRAPVPGTPHYTPAEPSGNPNSRGGRLGPARFGCIARYPFAGPPSGSPRSHRRGAPRPRSCRKAARISGTAKAAARKPSTEDDPCHGSSRRPSSDHRTKVGEPESAAPRFVARNRRSLDGFRRKRPLAATAASTHERDRDLGALLHRLSPVRLLFQRRLAGSSLDKAPADRSNERGWMVRAVGRSA
jgi:hypothetical protein